MSGILDRIRDRVGRECLTDSCSRDGCEVDMETQHGKLLAVDADKAFPFFRIRGKKCDLVLFLEGANEILVAVPVELKSGRVHTSVVEQLRAGAVFADCFAPQNANTVCRPILFHCNRLGWKLRDALNKAKIEFRGRSVTIRTARCGRPRNLAAALGALPS